jgi:alanine-glyoxylate transaminase/(R)-3-amino-2-methylpropionate-pyruvate transaminase
VACAQGRAVLSVIEQEGLQENSLRIGAQLRAGFERLAQKHSLIGDIRGLGLMLGVELVRDRSTKEPAKAECAAVFEACKDLGLLIGKGGLSGNTLRIKPPMIFSASDADFMLAVLDEALGAA